ncbi:hypothetical protein SEA_MOLIVIA_49 [Arthrobacter phage Molivia]|uniref:Uncharacterized protein n=1 Tax=Arthrobacter phage Molivia TaxID=2015839 RepID=A0A286S2D2_9CAUD|nr:hypothetical protein FDI28_gp65 [Arthrobacter phage Molivia]ASX99273.1 hypothetical protein SEA_MOLIVIA_49 [Arthrobacter phage Molivia]
MSTFSDALNADNARAIAPKNRVELLLDELEQDDPDNYEALIQALKDITNSNASITRTIKRIWGEDTVKTTSVRDYRVQNGII